MLILVFMSKQILPASDFDLECWDLILLVA